MTPSSKTSPVRDRDLKDAHKKMLKVHAEELRAFYMSLTKEEIEKMILHFAPEVAPVVALRLPMSDIEENLKDISAMLAEMVLHLERIRSEGRDPMMVDYYYLDNTHNHLGQHLEALADILDRDLP